MIRVTNGAGAVERRRYILDVMDPQDYATNVAGSIGYKRAGSEQGSGAQTVVWDAAASWLAEAGARNLGMVWAAAASVAATLKTRSSTRWQLPIGFDVGSMAQVGGEGFWPMRFRLETILWRVTDPLIAAAPVSFCCSWTGGALRSLDDATTNPGVELVSRSDLNGGAWTARARLAGGGALVQIENTGISPQGAGPMHLELRYDHKAVPRLSWFINGQEWGVMEGLANLPVGTSSLQVTGLVQGLSVGGGAGQLDRQRQTRFRIQELPGFPD